jgi:hypothetical protein
MFPGWALGGVAGAMRASFNEPRGRGFLNDKRCVYSRGCVSPWVHSLWLWLGLASVPCAVVAPI